MVKGERVNPESQEKGLTLLFLKDKMIKYNLEKWRYRWKNLN